MNISRPMTPQEREAYRLGYERGRQEGLKKASLLIQLVASDSSLKTTHVIQEDNRRCIPHFYHDISVDKENPRIEVTITELTPEQAKMKLRDLLKELETG